MTEPVQLFPAFTDFPYPALLRMKGAVPDYKATAWGLCEELRITYTAVSDAETALTSQRELLILKNLEAAQLQTALDQTGRALTEFFTAPFLSRLRYLFTACL